MAAKMALNSEIVIRPAHRSDIEVIAKIYNHAILHTTSTFDTEPKSPADRLAWLTSRDARHPVLVMEVNKQVVGWACLSPWSAKQAYAETAEGSLYIDPEFHGRGYGRRLNSALTEQARQLGLHCLIARITDGGDASIHLCESFGYQYVGTMKEVGKKFGKLLDVHLFQLLL